MQCKTLLHYIHVTRRPVSGAGGYGAYREQNPAGRIATAQAAVYFFQVLFRVYHGFDFDTRDVMILHERTRTLSAELFLLFESDSFTPIHTLPCLRRFIINARYDSSFFIHVTELEQHLDRVERMQSIVEKVCMQRIDLYNELARQDEPDEP